MKIIKYVFYMLLILGLTCLFLMGYSFLIGSLKLTNSENQYSEWCSKNLEDLISIAEGKRKSKDITSEKINQYCECIKDFTTTKDETQISKKIIENCSEFDPIYSKSSVEINVFFLHLNVERMISVKGISKEKKAKIAICHAREISNIYDKMKPLDYRTFNKYLKEHLEERIKPCSVDIL